MKNGHTDNLSRASFEAWFTLISPSSVDNRRTVSMTMIPKSQRLFSVCVLGWGTLCREPENKLQYYLKVYPNINQNMSPPLSPPSPFSFKIPKQMNF